MVKGNLDSKNMRVTLNQHDNDFSISLLVSSAYSNLRNNKMMHTEIFQRTSPWVCSKQALDSCSAKHFSTVASSINGHVWKVVTELNMTTASTANHY